MNKTIIFSILAVTILGGVGFFLYTQSKKRKKEEGGGGGSGAGGNGSGAGGTVWTMGYLSSRDGGAIPVHFNPRPAFSALNKGDKVRIGNTSFDGDYEVISKWKDANGNLGAIYLSVPYKPTGKSDKTFDKKGTIQKL